MKYLLVLHHIKYNKDRKHNIEFSEGADKMAKVEGFVYFKDNIQAVLCDTLEEGMREIRRQWLKIYGQSYWFDPKFADSITLCGSYSEIYDNKVWLNFPYMGGAEIGLRN